MSGFLETDSGTINRLWNIKASTHPCRASLPTIVGRWFSVWLAGGWVLKIGGWGGEWVAFGLAGRGVGSSF